jgi:hypothetical protein
MKSARSKKGPAIVFPTWKALINELLINWSEERKLDKRVVQQMSKSYLKKLSLVKSRIRRDPAIVVMSTLVDPEGVYSGGGSMMQVVEGLGSIRLGKNEFFAVYDTIERKYVYVDPIIEEVLGIAPTEFCVESVLGLLPENNICKQDDSAHMIRWAGIAYLILSLPGFSFNSFSDHYCVGVRINTSFSRRKDLADVGEAVMRKQCYLAVSQNEGGMDIPRYHVDRISINDRSSFEYVKPRFESDFVQSKYLNALAYLINCMLLDVDPKFVIMLEEKSRQERNKAIAEAINARLNQRTNINYRYTENQVADCFAKTIRSRVSSAINSWQKPVEMIEVLSDSDAVECSRQLGILPANPEVMDLIFRSLDERS